MKSSYQLGRWCQIFLGMLFVLVGCTQTPQEDQLFMPTPSKEQLISQPLTTPSANIPFPSQQVTTPTHQSTLTPDPTEEYIHSFPHPSTPFPTLSTEEFDRVVALLQSEECILPCYLGITPGQTTWEEAETILENLGAYFSFNTDEDGLTIHNVKLNTLSIRGDIMATGTPKATTGPQELEVIQSLQFTIDNGEIQRIRVRVHTSRFISEFQEYWSRYSLRELLLQHGVPDEIVMGRQTPKVTGYGIILIYQKSGIIVDLSGSQQNHHICPQTETMRRSLRLTLTAISSGLDIFGPGASPTNRDLYAPIEEILGIDETELYNQLIDDPSVCFEIKQADTSP
jgi:hypothetical protein